MGPPQHPDRRLRLAGRTLDTPRSGGEPWRYRATERTWACTPAERAAAHGPADAHTLRARRRARPYRGRWEERGTRRGRAHRRPRVAGPHCLRQAGAPFVVPARRSRGPLHPAGRAAKGRGPAGARGRPGPGCHSGDRAAEGRRRAGACAATEKAVRPVAQVAEGRRRGCGGPARRRAHGRLQHAPRVRRPVDPWRQPVGRLPHRGGSVHSAESFQPFLIRLVSSVTWL